MHQIELRNISLQYASAENSVTALQNVSFGVDVQNFCASWVKVDAAKRLCLTSLLDS